MDIHKNARLTLKMREQLARHVVEQGLSQRQAAQRFQVSGKTAGKWVARYRAQGVDGLGDRSSRPHRPHRPTPPALVDQVEQLRRQRWGGVRIALHTGLSRATVSRILRRLKLNRLRDLDPPQPVRRYEHTAPGDLLHLDIKKLGCFSAAGHRVHGDRRRTSKGAGWESVHVAIDDHSRIGFSAIHPNEKARSVCRFLLQALRYYARLGIRFRAILTDNGPAYHSRAFNRLCRRLGIKHRYTRPYTPRTNGKAERFIQTLLREWAYARAYASSMERALALPEWIQIYNCHRPHGSLGLASPISRAPCGTTC